jgi:hypothetical protein
MENHPTENEIILLCLAAAAEPASPETRSHIETGCPKCDERVNELRAVLATLAAPALCEVPGVMFQAALDWVSGQERACAQGAPADAVRSVVRRRPATSGVTGGTLGALGAAARFLDKIRAVLVLDSHAGMVLQGVRGLATANARQLLYESAAGSIHLLVEPAGVESLTVQGQFLPADESSPASGARAVMDVGDRETSVHLSSTGEFRFDGVPRGTIRLSLENGVSRVVLDPIEP